MALTIHRMVKIVHYLSSIDICRRDSADARGVLIWYRNKSELTFIPGFLPCEVQQSQSYGFIHLQWWAFFIGIFS